MAASEAPEKWYAVEAKNARASPVSNRFAWQVVEVEPVRARL